MASRDQKEALKKVDHGKATAWGENQIPDEGENAKFVGSKYKVYDNGNKPAERSLP